MAEESISELFSKHLPTVSSIIAEDMASGLNAYHALFKEYRDSAMNYDTHPEYVTKTFIMQLPIDQFWPYTPHFRKFMTLAIGELFKTKINYLATSPCTMQQTLIFLDDQKNRWLMRVEESACDPAFNQIIMYFPRSDTPMVPPGGKRRSTAQLLDNAFLKENNLGIIVEAIQDDWNAFE